MTNKPASGGLGQFLDAMFPFTGLSKGEVFGHVMGLSQQQFK
jgi:hypothetical protein